MSHRIEESDASEVDLDLANHQEEEEEENWQDAESEQHSEKKEEKKFTIDEENLRKKIKAIQQDSKLSPQEKAKKIQLLMSHGISHASSSQDNSKEDGYSKSYNKENVLGCKHYQRNCKLEANCCGKLVSCRFCHDDVEDHAIVRQDTKNMLCMICLKLQPAGQYCEYCNEQMACYYCDKCKLWDNDSNKSIYHCDECGICRQGKGLGEDFFHYYIQTSYQCPTCLKSLRDMSGYFDRLDKELERQPMPPEYEKFISHIFCNDCEKRTRAKYHFFYHKCGSCGSFNTTVLKTENTEEKSTQPILPQISSNEAFGLDGMMNQSTSSHYDRNSMPGPSSSGTDPDLNEG
ncbi:hypothetical protein G6F57_005712 [Rhizopus arrhizus]|uniref:CHY-type domain-containing protein n=1 Tax=Rhizopus oryzae TaxID=64495 RepID=A0A9P6XCR5_RHIOR|nr:hypothetical protein G6F21_011457 [Rhizopus arrhizus]KAG1406183.1 hypothetical protein G6F58_009880 [Rhizopus delemar]KAG0785807.1 hypothetical protein G6F22_007832 [Rhizopus arrhizus]KAG0815930.1 hypothetical protein G6F20_003607 [Rhizopus arrhizus]KAG0833651.1 hypothetical protein G6F18_006692 [Rhizopus arrhizus]